MNWQPFFDALFRLGLYRGIRVSAPADLVSVSLMVGTLPVRTYVTDINQDHALSAWLFEDCAGPWMVRLARPLYNRRPVLCFARHADALIFRILSA